MDCFLQGGIGCTTEQDRNRVLLMERTVKGGSMPLIQNVLFFFDEERSRRWWGLLHACREGGKRIVISLVYVSVESQGLLVGEEGRVRGVW